MKILIRVYQNTGNCTTDAIYVSDNKLIVSDLKYILYDKYRIIPSEQRLTTKIANKQIVNLPNPGDSNQRLAFIFLLHKR
jgi:hypothetical protein